MLCGALKVRASLTKLAAVLRGTALAVALRDTA